MPGTPVDTPVFPLPIGDGDTTQWGIFPSSPSTHYTKVDEAWDLDGLPGGGDYIISTGIAAPLEEFLIPAEIPEGTEGTLTCVKIAYASSGVTITLVPGLKFQLFIDPDGDGNRTQIGDDIEVDATNDNVTAFQVAFENLTTDLDDWIGASKRILAITSIENGGSLPEPDVPDFEMQ